MRYSLTLLLTFSLALLGLLGMSWWVDASSIPSPVASVFDPPPPEMRWISTLTPKATDLSPWFVGEPHRRPVGELARWSGYVRATSLPQLEARREVLYLATDDARPRPPVPDPAHSVTATLPLTLTGRARVAAIQARAAQATRASTSPQVTAVRPQGWYENDTQGVHQTWHTLGITGTGATIAVLDSGVDFGNPALWGRHAVQPATVSGTQAYAGWPLAFDARSLEAYLAEPDRAWPSNWGWFVNAGQQITGSGVFTFTDPQAPTEVYTAPGTSLSGAYRLGYHPDPALNDAPVLVADEAIAGQYNAVYMDLDYDGTFETRMSRKAPVGVLDLTGDGVQDTSAGMLTWIADGSNPPPGAEAVYGAGTPVPAPGTLVALMMDSVWERGGGHGTECAGSAVGNDGGVFVPESRIPDFYDPMTYGPLVQGPAPGARIIAAGNVYEGGAMDAWYLFTMVGLDGVPNTGDEPDVVTLSYGSGTVDSDGWDAESRLIDKLTLEHQAHYGPGAVPLYVVSAGNGGYGYGTLISPAPRTALKVGASTQYGTLNFMGISETVSLPSRVNTGDVASFSGRGPGADGTRAIDLVANGMAGTGGYPLNAFGDGTRAYVTWKGTSRSTPVVGGMAALSIQAYRQAHGRAPTNETLRMLLMNGAEDLGYDPLVQGAGRANAYQATRMALGEQGVRVSPPALVGGDFRGARYPAFAQGLTPGETETLSLTLTNTGATPVTLSLGAERLVEVAHYTATLETITDTFTHYYAGVPDYALNLTPWVKAHPDADLMSVRMTFPFEHFDEVPPAPPTAENEWRLLLYNWWDDGDGAWWTDLNGNGRVNGPEEVDGEDEWMRFDYSWLRGTQQEVRVGRPFTRSVGAGSGGIWAGAAHTKRSDGDNRTTLHFDVIFYRRTEWDAVSVSPAALTLAGQTTAPVTATIQVSSNAAPGLHQGLIIVEDATGAEPTRQIPLTWQVWPDATRGTMLGGAADAGTPYGNGWLGGGFTWSGYEEESDWRFYGFDLVDPPLGSALIVHNVWANYPTDIDTLIWGPTGDLFSASDPAWFGPYTLDEVARSTYAGSPPIFNTATGDTEEWLATPVRDGLHLLAHRAVLLGGQRVQEPFTTEMGLMSVEPYPAYLDPTTCTPTCTLTMTLKTSLDVSAGFTATYGFGWITPTVWTAQSIGTGETVTYSLFFTEPLHSLEANLFNVTGADDLSLALYDDTGDTAGVWDTADRLLARSADYGPAPSLRKQALLDGQHWLRVTGEEVAGGGQYNLAALVVPWSADGAYAVRGLPETVTAHHPSTFTVQTAQRPRMGEVGRLIFGIPELREMLVAEIETAALADLWIEKRGPAEGRVGDVFTYTLVYGNAGPSPAEGVVISDTLPAALTTTLPLTLDVGTLAPGAVHTWTLTATVAATDVPPCGTPVTNTAQITGNTLDPNLDNNVDQERSLIQLYHVYLPVIMQNQP
ncbi:MAG: S8 family serine peptidase [Anaerolineae bacterium]